MISQSIQNQTIQIFQNIDILLNEFSDTEFTQRKGGFIVWKQFYHLIHSIDKNFIDPSSHIEPYFHVPNLDIINFDSENDLTKNDIIKYYEHVKTRTTMYISSLTDEVLIKTVVFRDMTLTSLELILAQLRHVFFHIGYFHCILKMENGSTPDYVGLYKAIAI